MSNPEELAAAALSSSIKPADTKVLPSHIQEEQEEVSDISEEYEEGDGQNAANVVGKFVDYGYYEKKKFRILWNTTKEAYLLKCYNHYRLASNGGHSLRGNSWTRIAHYMTAKFHEDYDSKSCRNKFNVLRYDYLSYHAVVQARNSGTADEAFWTNLIEKNPRAVKFKDFSVYPHYELLYKILEENGAGVELLPENGDEGLGANMGTPYLAKGAASASGRKRPRESAGGFSAYPLLDSATPMGGGGMVGGAELEDALSRQAKELGNRFSYEVSQLLQSIASSATLVVKSAEQWHFELIQSVVEQLGQEKYAVLMKDVAQRKKIMQLFKFQPEHVKDFLLTPEKDRFDFVQDLLNSTQ